MFCRLSRAFFRASGAYFWSYTPDGELVGVEADGHQASSIIGMRLRAADPSVVMEAVQQRQPVVENQIALARYPLLSDSPAYAALAAPLRVSGEVVGAISFVHTTAGATFDDDALPQVTILAAQLCSAIETLRLNQFSREERRRTALLMEVAADLHGLPDTSVLVQSIADRLRDLLRSPVVLIFVQHENLFQLQAVSAEAPRLLHAIRARSRTTTCVRLLR